MNRAKLFVFALPLLALGVASLVWPSPRYARVVRAETDRRLSEAQRLFEARAKLVQALRYEMVVRAAQDPALALSLAPAKKAKKPIGADVPLKAAETALGAASDPLPEELHSWAFAWITSPAGVSSLGEAPKVEPSELGALAERARGAGAKGVVESFDSKLFRVVAAATSGTEKGSAAGILAVAYPFDAGAATAAARAVGSPITFIYGDKGEPVGSSLPAAERDELLTAARGVKNGWFKLGAGPLWQRGKLTLPLWAGGELGKPLEPFPRQVGVAFPFPELDAPLTVLVTSPLAESAGLLVGFQKRELVALGAALLWTLLFLALPSGKRAEKTATADPTKSPDQAETRPVQSVGFPKKKESLTGLLDLPAAPETSPSDFQFASEDPNRTRIASLAMLQSAAQGVEPEIPFQSDPRSFVTNAPAEDADAELLSGDPLPEGAESGATVVARIPEALLKQAHRPPPPPPAASADPEDSHFQEVFRQFVAARNQCGEPADGLTFDKFVVKLRKNREQMAAKYSCRTVRFQVYVKDGKAALKATPVKD